SPRPPSTGYDGRSPPGVHLPIDSKAGSKPAPSVMNERSRFVAQASSLQPMQPGMGALRSESPSIRRCASPAIEFFSHCASLEGMPRIPIEDNFDDVIKKAQRGLRLNDSELAPRAGVTPAELRTLRGGAFDERVVRAVAPVLHLGADQLVALARKAWYP